MLCMCAVGNEPRALRLLANHSKPKLHPSAFGFLRQELATQPRLALNL